MLKLLFWNLRHVVNCEKIYNCCMAWKENIHVQRYKTLQLILILFTREGENQPPHKTIPSTIKHTQLDMKMYLTMDEKTHRVIPKPTAKYGLWKHYSKAPFLSKEVYNHLLASRILCLESKATFGKRSVVLFLLLSKQSFLREQSSVKKSVELKTF